MDHISTIVLGSALSIIMLGMGLSLVINDFKRIIVYPKAIVIGLTNQLIILPIIGFTIVSILPLNPEIAIGIMILAACPGGPTSNLISHLAKGDIALSVTLTAISSFITIITIPFIVNFALNFFINEGEIIKLPIIETIINIMTITIIPISIGMIIRRYRENFALKMAKPVKIASGIIIALIIIGLVIKKREDFIDYFQRAGIAALILNITTMLVGFLSSKLFKIINKRAISISIESGIQNGTLAIAIAVALLKNDAYAIAPAVYSIIMFFTGGILIAYGIKTSKSKLSS